MGITLPNVRKLFIPDSGYTIFDADLSGADAMVVAAESGDQKLIKAIQSGYDLHTENMIEMFGRTWYDSAPPHKRHEVRQQCKSAVHGTNYGASARTLAITFNWTIATTERFQSIWFRKHPGIKQWHERVNFDLSNTRTVWNKFGYRIIYFDRLDNVFTEALAWIPQSTVAEVCFRGALALEDKCPFVEILLQVHDSLVFQIPTKLVSIENLHRVKEALHIPIPYADPLVIPWGFAKSEKSWGDCEDFDL